MDKWGRIKHHSKKVWRFFWHDDSIWSWFANIIVAFLVIRYIVYPVLGIILGTSFPIVAVVSESMEHSLTPVCTGYNLETRQCEKYSKTEFTICGNKVKRIDQSFDNYWEICGEWYEENGLTKEQFASFPFNDGFDKGDVIILWRANRNNLEVGDILIFQELQPQPIIHRIVNIKEENGQMFYHTKGDHNTRSIEPSSGYLGETEISEERILGKGILRVPYLGWLKILFVDAVRPLGINIQR